MKCISLPSFEALVPAIQGNEVLDVLNTQRAERLLNDERSLLTDRLSKTADRNEVDALRKRIIRSLK
jgi:hypothetical protein